MGTRYLTCVVKGGEYKIAQYGQHDGYPEGAGKEILRFLQNTDISNLRKEVSKLRFATEKEADKFDEDQRNHMYSLTDEQYKIERREDMERWMRPTQELLDRYYSRPLLQFNLELGYGILGLILRGHVTTLIDSLNFAGDSLFCEWAYVIDLDKNSFEVYRGFNREPVPEGERFADFKGTDEFYPVKLLSEFDLENLPSEDDFLQHCPDIE